MSFIRRLFLPLLTAVAVLFGSVLVAAPARADEVISDQASITKAADWIAQQWADGTYTTGDAGLLADGIMALASARQHHDTMEEMVAGLEQVGPTYVINRADALAKVILTADIAGVEDPAHFFGPDRDLVQELIDYVNAKKAPQAWGGYLATIALSRLGRLDDVSDEGMTYLMSRMIITKDGGFGWYAAAPTGDPDYTGIGISAMLLLSRDDEVAARYREEAATKLASGIAWTENAANRFTNDDGDYFWMASFGGADGASSNSTGMVASALAEAGVNIESPKRAMKKEQAATDSGAAWSNTRMGTRDDIRATVQAIFAITGAGYATADWDDYKRDITVGTAEISGTAKVGEKLTVTSTGWEPADVTLSYAWFRDGAQLPGIDTASYTVSKYNIGKKMTVKVTASADGYADASVTTAPTATVVGMTLKTAKPTISGTRQVGHTLTAKAGSWTSGTKLSYQWYRDGKKLTGYTKSTFALTQYSLGKTLTVQVIGTKDGYESASVTSAKTAKVKAGTLKSATPKISGTTKVGSKLTAKAGSWTSGTKLSYQWYRDGKKLNGYTKSTFTLTKYSKGKKLSVHVTGKKAGYTTVTTHSARTAAVK
ncbi:hypothetical protein [Tessaracoccus palaemonis]|uniref:Ig-like domain-containing protein n=1 Tax=Tessaracoccus palaemonis TaxID=2829499 RepID=A0ABX8SN77_9ACTN|nr:hypothetical protein [Tessaracoccus palaemonis]QXT63618.1 hypothetical protein KDB89_03835 [Tessaracoccus palaemonis]